VRSEAEIPTHQQDGARERHRHADEERVGEALAEEEPSPMATKTGARLNRSVELATEVNTIDQCQRAMSPAKKAPARVKPRMIRCPESRRSGTAARRFPTSVYNHRTGRARARRQKAVVAVGPSSLRRTKMGEQSMPTAPEIRAARGADSVTTDAGDNVDDPFGC
jgi:hypothetical protein